MNVLGALKSLTKKNCDNVYKVLLRYVILKISKFVNNIKHYHLLLLPFGAYL